MDGLTVGFGFETLRTHVTQRPKPRTSRDFTVSGGSAFFLFLHAVSGFWGLQGAIALLQAHFSVRKAAVRPTADFDPQSSPTNSSQSS